jgi:chromate transporter
MSRIVWSGSHGMEPTAYPKPTLAQAARVWLRIGLLSFGGPTGQIALMHRELVETRPWIDDRRFLNALNYCMVLPGPEAQQLAVYIGWLMHGTRGGILAGALFVLPGALIMLAISIAYVWFGSMPSVAAAFDGLKPAVMALVAAALVRMGKKVLGKPNLQIIAALSFIAVFFFMVPFPLLILCALILGWWHGRDAAAVSLHTAPNPSDPTKHAVSSPILSKTISRAATWLAVWLAPPTLCLAMLGADHVLTRIGWFFSKAACVTFGGAYAVLPYVAQQAVHAESWLNTAQMMDGLALAETTPGPLVLVLQFVGFLAGWNEAGTLPPLLMAFFAAGMASWCTFMPAFLFIFGGAPFIERAGTHPRLNHALSAVTAAAVGVILNLAVWFAWHTIKPDAHTTQLLPLALAGTFFYLLHFRKWGIFPTLALAAGMGMLLS